MATATVKTKAEPQRTHQPLMTAIYPQINAGQSALCTSRAQDETQTANIATDNSGPT